MDKNEWGCYLIRSLNSDRTYVGATNNLEARLTKHNSSRGAKYTMGQHWICVLFVSGFDCKRTCLSFEYQFKRLSTKRTNKRFELLNYLSFTPHITPLVYTKDYVCNRILDLFYYTHTMTIINDTKCFVNKDEKYLWIYVPLQIKFMDSSMQKSIDQLIWANNLVVVFN
jgi:putative endonuclease